MVYASFPNEFKTNIITKEKNQIEIPAGSDYYIKFNSQQKKRRISTSFNWFI